MKAYVHVGGGGAIAVEQEWRTFIHFIICHTCKVIWIICCPAHFHSSRATSTATTQCNPITARKIEFHDSENVHDRDEFHVVSENLALIIYQTLCMMDQIS